MSCPYCHKWSWPDWLRVFLFFLLGPVALFAVLWWISVVAQFFISLANKP